MKIIYIEADANELKVRPTVMSALESFVHSVAWSFGCDAEYDEHGEEQKNETD